MFYLDYMYENLFMAYCYFYDKILELADKMTSKHSIMNKKKPTQYFDETHYFLLHYDNLIKK